VQRDTIAESDQSPFSAQRWISRFCGIKTSKRSLLPDFYSRQKNPYKSTMSALAEWLANNLVHNKCGEVHSDTDPEFQPETLAFFLRMRKID
jgi:hypothetical protein